MPPRGPSVGLYHENNPVTTSNRLPVDVGGLVPDNYDTINLTYVASGNGAGEIETVTYIASASTLTVLTLSYNADNKLAGVVKS